MHVVADHFAGFNDDCNAATRVAQSASLVCTRGLGGCLSLPRTFLAPSPHPQDFFFYMRPAPHPKYLFPHPPYACKIFQHKTHTRPVPAKSVHVLPAQ